MIDTKELRKGINRHGASIVCDDELIELLDRLEAVEKDNAKLRSEIGEAIDAAVEMIERMEKMEAALRIAVQQNSHDMLMTGDELRQCGAALEESK